MYSIKGQTARAKRMARSNPNLIIKYNQYGMERPVGYTTNAYIIHQIAEFYKQKGIRYMIDPSDRPIDPRYPLINSWNDFLIANEKS